jgi:hypothetical protein
MSKRAITRQTSVPVTATVVVATDADLTATAVCIEAAAMGMIWIPSNFDGTQVKYHVCSTYGGTYVVLGQTTDGADLTHTVAASKGFALPEQLFGAPYFKVETVTDQADTDTVFTFTFKG